MASPPDPRLSGFDWNARRAAPVPKLMDPHVHYSGEKQKLATLAEVTSQYNVECVFLNSQLDPGEGWLKDVQEFFTIGKSAVPFYRVDMTSNDPAQVGKAHDLGFWGIKCISPDHSYDDRFFDPIYAKAQELGMPLLFHTGLLSKGGRTREIGCGMSLMRADCLDTIESRFPELLIQGAHLGNPDIANAILSCQYAPNLIWDASGGCRHILQVEPKFLAAPLNGRPRLWKCFMWATDTNSGKLKPEYSDGWPTQYEYQLACWQDILSRFPTPPSSDQLDDFFYGNARRWLERIVENRKA